MKIQGILAAAGETITIDRANTGGLQELAVSLGADARVEILTDDPLELPTLGTLPYGALTLDPPRPIRGGDPELAG